MKSAEELRQTAGRCPVCQRRGRPWASMNGYCLSRCGVCGVIVAFSNDGSAVENPATYANYHKHSSFSLPDTVQASLAKLVAMAETYRESGRWLDLGFGEGALLSVAERAGWACFGTEISPHALAFGYGRGWTVSSDPERDPRFPRGAFDVVTMLEVLEHLPNPRAFLRDAACRLRQGGLLYLTTPNARSLNRWILGSRWSVVCPPEHLMVWTAPALRRLVAECGLQTLRLRTEGLNPAELIASLHGGVNPSEVHRQSAGVALSHALSTSGSRRVLKRAANEILNLLGVGDTVKVWCQSNDA